MCHLVELVGKLKNHLILSLDSSGFGCEGS